MNFRSTINLFSVFPVLAMLLLSSNLFVEKDKGLLGHWIYDSVSEEGITYSKKSDFVRSKPGIAFLANGKLIKRQNAGWCGTPPISYSNFDGTWKWDNENTISLSYAFWGGTINEVWEIDFTKEKILSVKSTFFETVDDRN